MSTPHEPSPPLSNLTTASVDELVQELRSRHNIMIIIASESPGQPQGDYLISAKGPHNEALGIMDIARHLMVSRACENYKLTRYDGEEADDCQCPKCRARRGEPPL